jgi:hypothetical protein
LAELFTGHAASELVNLETRWASLISFGLTVDCSQGCPADRQHHNPKTIRQHLHRVANWHEADLGAKPAGSGDNAPTAG